jgi:hypothetical protein
MTTEEVAIRPNKAKALKDLGFLNRPAKIPVPCSNKLGRIIKDEHIIAIIHGLQE